MVDQINGQHPEIKDEAKIRRVVLGTGLKIWTGRIREEYLTALQPWTRAAKIYREMRDETTIGSLLEAIKTPLLSTHFEVHPYIEPGDDENPQDRPSKSSVFQDEPPNPFKPRQPFPPQPSPDRLNQAKVKDQDKRAAELVEKALFRIPNMEWREHAEEMLDFLDFGFAVSEKVFYKDKQGHILPDVLLPVGQETLERWGDPDNYGHVSSFIQRDPVTGQLREASSNKLIHFTWRSRKRDPMGYSLLRSLYRPWFFMKNLEVLEAIGVERDVGNVPVAKLGETFLTDEQYTKLETGLAGLRLDETAYLIVPGDIEVTPLGSGGKVYDVRGIIRDYQHKIRQRFFADFLAMGGERVGTQALSRELSSFFSLALRAVQERMLEIWQRQLIKPILELNDFPEEVVEHPPRLAWTRPGAKNMQMVAQAMNSLVSSDIITPDDDLEHHIREEFGFPPPGKNPRHKSEQFGGFGPGMTREGDSKPGVGPVPGKNGVPPRKPAGEPGRVTPDSKMAERYLPYHLSSSTVEQTLLGLYLNGTLTRSEAGTEYVNWLIAKEGKSTDETTSRAKKFLEVLDGLPEPRPFGSIVWNTENNPEYAVAATAGALLHPGTWRVVLRAAGGVGAIGGQISQLFVGGGLEQDAVARAKSILSKKWNIPISKINIEETEFIRSDLEEVVYAETGNPEINDLARELKRFGFNPTFLSRESRRIAFRSGIEWGSPEYRLARHFMTSRFGQPTTIDTGQNEYIESWLIPSLGGNGVWEVILHPRVPIERADSGKRFFLEENTTSELIDLFCEGYGSYEDQYPTFGGDYLERNYAQVTLEVVASDIATGADTYYTLDIRDRQSNRLAGEMKVLVPDPDQDDKTAVVHFLEIWPEFSSIETVQSLRAEFRKLFPWIASVVGFRVTGARRARPKAIARFLQEEEDFWSRVYSNIGINPITGISEG